VEQKSTAEGHHNLRLAAEDRRKQLAQVALKLFAKKGFRGTTTKEIAHASEINEALIFRHFSSKEDLYCEILNQKANEGMIEPMVVRLAELARQGDDEGLFRTLALMILDHYRCDPEFVRLMLYSGLEGHQLSQSFRERQVRPIYDFLCGYVAERQKSGVFKPGNPGALVRAFVGMCSYHALVTQIFGCQLLVISDEEAIDTFTQVMLNGLRSRTNNEDQV
jgi:AcrR family transcriptional regulator